MREELRRLTNTLASFKLHIGKKLSTESVQPDKLQGHVFTVAKWRKIPMMFDIFLILHDSDLMQAN